MPQKTGRDGVAVCPEEAGGQVALDRFHIHHLPADALAGYRLRKRLLDMAVVTATLPLTLPIVALAGLAIGLTMGRPILFVQTRVGLGGEVFAMFKLRTMRAAGPGMAGAVTAGDDARVTPVGRWLRRHHIDQLPQLWNVLRGEMSLVGPRPEQPGLAMEYGRRVPAFVHRHRVRPGITGWAQVRAGYAADLAQTRVKLAFDLFYLKNLSLALDLQILARTLWILARGAGDARWRRCGAAANGRRERPTVLAKGGKSANKGRTLARRPRATDSFHIRPDQDLRLGPPGPAVGRSGD